MLDNPSDLSVVGGNPLMDPTFEDMKEMAMILSNVTQFIDSAPEKALSVASQNLGWMYARDVPKLVQMMLDEMPEIRKDNAMMRAYMFVMDFLEIISKETAQRLKENQKYLRMLMEASKVSEDEIDSCIAANKDKFLSSDFTVYLDSEIDSQEFNSAMENLLVTIKLRLLDEKGKDLGVDVMMLPKLAAESNPAELKRKTLAHVEDYDDIGKELFLQTLAIMLDEMEKRYKQVDPLLILNLREVEKIVSSLISSN